MAAPGVNAATDSVGMEIFAKMANEMDTEGRYLFLNALANQLRYPNNHTHYFSCILLELFHRAEQVPSFSYDFLYSQKRTSIVTMREMIRDLSKIVWRTGLTSG